MNPGGRVRFGSTEESPERREIMEIPGREGDSPSRDYPVSRRINVQEKIEQNGSSIFKSIIRTPGYDKELNFIALEIVHGNMTIRKGLSHFIKERNVTMQIDEIGEMSFTGKNLKYDKIKINLRTYVYEQIKRYIEEITSGFENVISEISMKFV